MHVRIDGPCLAPRVGFSLNNVAGDRQDVVSGLVQLSIPFRRLHACAIYDANFPVLRTIRALYFRRDLAKLEVLGVTHAGETFR